MIINLKVLHAPEDHTAENIKTMMLNVLDDWSLDERKISALSTDNASNMVKACSLLGKWNSKMTNLVRLSWW